MSYAFKFRSALTPLTAVLLMQLLTVESGASTLDDIPGDVVRVNLSKHLYVCDMVSLSLVSKKLRQKILRNDNGRKTLRSAMARLEIHVHDGKFDNNTVGYTKEQIAKGWNTIISRKNIRVSGTPREQELCA